MARSLSSTVVTRNGNSITAYHAGSRKLETLDILTVKAFHWTTKSDIDLALQYDILDFSAFDIISHEGESIQNISFEVKFMDNVEDTYWVPLSFVQDHKEFENYCRIHNLELEIPKVVTNNKSSSIKSHFVKNSFAAKKIIANPLVNAEDLVNNSVAQDSEIVVVDSQSSITIDSPSFPPAIVVAPPDKNVSRYGRTRIPTVKGGAHGGR